MRQLLGIPRIGDAVGGSFPLGDATAVPLPHPSGASGWLNDPANRRQLAGALELLHLSLQELNGEIRPRPPSFG